MSINPAKKPKNQHNKHYISECTEQKTNNLDLHKYYLDLDKFESSLNRKARVSGIKPSYSPKFELMSDSQYSRSVFGSKRSLWEEGHTSNCTISQKQDNQRNNDKIILEIINDCKDETNTIKQIPKQKMKGEQRKVEGEKVQEVIDELKKRNQIYESVKSIIDANRMDKKKEQQNASYLLAKVFEKDNMYDEIINIFRSRYQLTSKKSKARASTNNQYPSTNKRNHHPQIQESRK